MEKSPISFSRREYRYHAELKRGKPVFHWTEVSEIQDWDNCTVSALKLASNEIRIVVRSSYCIYSKYMKRNIKVKYMLGFDVTHIHELRREDYPEPSKDNVKTKFMASVDTNTLFNLMISGYRN